jgi:putative flavoprotein involved in K+ transport
VIVDRYDTIVIGAGQAGLAMSRVLSDRGVDHVVFERGRLAERWRSERWDSLRLLTPNWMTRLPGQETVRTDPDGFMTKDELVGMLESYAGSFGAPVRENVNVESVSRTRHGYEVLTDAGRFAAHNVVIATGQCATPSIPAFADALDVEQMHSARYRNPATTPPGGVLVVGAGASGLQIAGELRDAGRDVVLAVGRHSRAVRSYRGMDLWWWLDRIGSLSQTVDEVEDIEAARSAPSLGLSGGDRDIDLGTLRDRGVVVAGRLLGAAGRVVDFDTNAVADAAVADTRLARLLDRFDAWAAAEGLDSELAPGSRPRPVVLDRPLSGPVDLAERGIGTVLWATGYGPSYPWLRVPVLDARGEIVQRRGETASPGLYVLGLRFQWRRDSHFLDGVGRDAEHVGDHIAARRAAAVA